VSTSRVTGILVTKACQDIDLKNPKKNPSNAQ
jgi:hypothetical protein